MSDPVRIAPAPSEGVASDPGPSLHPDHLADLRRSGLADDTIAAAEIRSLSPVDLRRFLGEPIARRVTSAYLIPYPEAEGFFRAKLFPPVSDGDGHAQRYSQPAGSAPRLFTPPRARRALTDPTIPLRWTEGEKKALRADQEGLACIGLGGLWNWLTEARPIADLTRVDHVDRLEILTADSDVWTRPDLLRAVYAFGKELEALGASVRVEKIPAGPDGAKVGLDDFLCAHSVAELEALPKLPLTHRAFSHAADWWRSWNKRREADSREPNGASREIVLTDPEPWLDPVHGAGLLDEMAETFTRFVVLPPGGADALALWLLHTYAHEAVDLSPLLVLSSPVKRCGKTTALSIALAMARRSLPTSNITPAALFRAVERFAPTLLVDEADTFLENDELRGILNAGHTRQTAYVIRTVGDEHEPRVFSTWGPKMIALIGRLPDTLEDRAVVLRMRRRGPKESVERLRVARLSGHLAPLRRRAMRWAGDHQAALGDADPALPPELNDREQDNWRPLVAIAELAGGDWPDRARRAARLLSGASADEDASEAVLLLGDIRAVFGERDRLPTVDLLAELYKLEERPWSDYRHGRPLTSHQLAGLLREFGIRPRAIRTGTGTPRGYLAKGFEDAWARYTPLQTATPQQTHGGAELDDISNRNTDPPVADREGEGTARNHSDVAAVADLMAVTDGGASLRDHSEACDCPACAPATAEEL